MDLQLERKTAVVSGSSAGIGFAIANLLAQEGVRVIVNGRSRDRVEEAVRKIGRNASGVVADLGTVQGAETLVAAVPTCDILVNNLGIFAAQEFLEITDRDWEHFFQVNVMSGVRLSRHYFPGMKAHNWGRIIFISSESALQIPAEMVHYGMTKTAQIAVARGLAETTQGTAVTVNSILAGPTKSEGVADFVKSLSAARQMSEAGAEKEFFRTARPTSLLKRFETPEEVAHLVVFVCSPLASGINGAALRVEGGVVRSIV